jgi:hypothetical protein
VIGFFFYAFHTHFQTHRISEWTNILSNSQTDSEICAVALLLNSLSISADKLPDYLRLFIAKHLLFHGHPTLSADRLAYAFHKEHGVKWYLIRSIINLDRAQFAPSPLVKLHGSATGL